MPGNIPHDIVIDILLKLPVKSLLRFKPVCKLWHSLIEDPQFIKQQHYHKIFLACYKDRYCSIDAPHQHDSAVSLIEPPPGINDHSLRNIFVNSCKGLFLLCFPSPQNEIVLWIPALRESRTIPSPTPIVDGFEYGLVYVSSLNDYKIVSVSRYNGAVQIFSTKSGSWKLIKLRIHNYAYIENIVVSDGIAYIILKRKSGRCYIICLFLINEKIEKISLPDSDIQSNKVNVYAVGGNLLAVFWTKFFCIENVDFEFWCLEKDGLMSWRKILAIKEPGLVNLDEGMFFFSWDKIEYMFYDYERKKFKEFKVDGLRKLKKLRVVGPQASILIHRVVPYVETLISPNDI